MVSIEDIERGGWDPSESGMAKKIAPAEELRDLLQGQIRHFMDDTSLYPAREERLFTLRGNSLTEYFDRSRAQMLLSEEEGVQEVGIEVMRGFGLDEGVFQDLPGRQASAVWLRSEARVYPSSHPEKLAFRRSIVYSRSSDQPLWVEWHALRP